jgi:hypothetical protein
VNRMTSATTDLVEFKNYMNRYECDCYRMQLSLFCVLLQKGLKEQPVTTHAHCAVYVSS